MRLTIVRDDNAVVVDGVPFMVDCSSLPADVHAVQWDGVSGEVEYSVTRCDHCGARTKKGNTLLVDVTPYAPLVNAWHAAKAADDEAKAKAAAEEQVRIAAAKATSEAQAKAAAEAPQSEGASNAAGPQS